MDLLYSRYADPDRFMNTYIAQGRFGEFVAGVLEMDRQRKEKEYQKMEDDRLWLAYIFSMTEKSFHEWKKELVQRREPVSYAMTDRQVDAVKQQAKGILDKIAPAG